jgi:hypothetical protein
MACTCLFEQFLTEWTKGVNSSSKKGEKLLVEQMSTKKGKD